MLSTNASEQYVVERDAQVSMCTTVSLVEELQHCLFSNSTSGTIVTAYSLISGDLYNIEHYERTQLR